jgi:hypothetical protein
VSVVLAKRAASTYAGGVARIPVFAALSALILVPACTSLLRCPVSVDSYCASTSAAECKYRNYEEALWEWNQGATASTAPFSTVWGCAQNDDYAVLSVERVDQKVTVRRYFLRSSGELRAVLRNPGDGRGNVCVAGPPLFAPPDFSGEDKRCGFGTPPDGAAP